ncbi:MAG: hypothetical protein QW057_05285 [Candidatus Bathyarchaeia archaeon]
MSRGVEGGDEAGQLEALRRRLRELEGENEALSEKLRRLKRRPSRLSGLLLLSLGGVLIVFATVYSSLIPAFIGLSLTFWGALLLYVRPVRYVRRELAVSLAANTHTSLRELLKETGYTSRALYLPPRAMGEQDKGSLLVSKGPNLAASATSRSQGESSHPAGTSCLALTPPGLDLARLMQRELGRDLATVDLEYLAAKLPKVMVEDLEVAGEVEIEPRGDVVSVKVSQPLFPIRLGEEAEAAGLDCLTSAIACILTWTTAKPIAVELLTSSGDTLEARFRILGA